MTGTEAAIQTAVTFVWRDSRSSNRTRAKFLVTNTPNKELRHGLRILKSSA